MNPEVIGQNIRRLRAGKKLTQIELAEKAGISRVSLSRIEKGMYRPRVSTLEKLAAALESSLGQLLEEVPPLAEVRFRALKRHHERDQIIADVARKLERYRDVEEVLGDRREFKFADLRKNPVRDPVELADRVRKAAGLGEEPIRDICGFLEHGGIKLVRIRRATDAFFGLSVAPGDYGPAIIVNTWEKISVERWIFTAAHELGHLLMHSRAYDANKMKEDRNEEKAADIFAAHLLMPNGVFRSEWDDTIGLPLLDRVFKVKRIFRVSWGTVLYRLIENEDVDASIWAVFQNRYKERYRRTLGRKDEPLGVGQTEFHAGAPVGRGNEPEQLSEIDFREDRLNLLVRKALQRGDVSMGWAAEALDVSRKEMRQLAGEWAEN